MAISIVMPALELAQETGTLLSWRKGEGDGVTKGEPLAEVETDKAVVEIESPGDGILAGVAVKEGAVVPVGQVIAWIVQPGEAPPVDLASGQSGRRAETGPARQTAAATSASAHAPETSLKISPKARRLAQERGVDVNRVTGSGPDGEILAEDILALARSQSAHNQKPTE